MENKISEILGFEVESVQAEEIQNFNNLEIIEGIILNITPHNICRLFKFWKMGFYIRINLIL